MRRGLILMLAAVALATGCGDGAGRADPEGAAAATAPAVVLRAQLASALDARAWLTAVALRTQLVAGARSPAARGLRQALDASSRTLATRASRALGSRPTLLGVLQRQDAEALRLTRTSAGELAAALGGPGTRDELARAGRALDAAVRAVAAGSPAGPARTATAAARAARVAAPLARAAKRRRPAELAGSPRSPAAELAESASIALTDHAYAQATADALVLAGATTGPRLRRATATLDASTAALGQLVAAVQGDDGGQRFASAWRARSIALLDYARAKRTKDTPGAAAARRALDRSSRATTGLLADLDPHGRPPGLRALRAQADAATAAVRAQATGSVLAGRRLLTAAAASQALSHELVRAWIRQHPQRFQAG